MHFVPDLVDRSRGDFLDSQWFNQQSQDIYADLLYLFDSTLELYGKSKIMAELVEATNIGFARAVGEPLPTPKIGITEEFFFPESLPKCIVDRMFGEITLPIGAEEQQLVTSLGKVRDTIEVRRFSDNFIFSTIPESVSESRILDAIEESQFPYMVRVRGVNDSVKVKMTVSTEFSAMFCNVIEFVPAPYIGGTAIEYLILNSVDDTVSPPSDFQGQEIKIKQAPVNYRYRPVRLHISPDSRKSITLGYDGLSRLEGQNLMLAGLFSFRVVNRVWNSKGYIGFRIPGDQRGTLVRLVPVKKWLNTYIGAVTFKVYKQFSDMFSANNNYVGVFNQDGIGSPVTVEEDLYVLAEITSPVNASPQLIGFDYEIAII